MKPGEMMLYYDIVDKALDSFETLSWLNVFMAL